MKLWHLYAKDKAIDAGTYDCYHAFIVRAESRNKARKIASNNAGDEGEEVWLSPDLSVCEELTTKGAAEVIMSDYLHG